MALLKDIVAIAFNSDGLKATDAGVTWEIGMSVDANNVASIKDNIFFITLTILSSYTN